MKRTHKVIGVALLMVVLFALPLLAQDNYMIWIDGVPKQSDVLWKDNHVYVPVRLVAENLDCDVDWVDGHVAIKSAAIQRPTIKGDERFVVTINQALDLLEKKDPADYCLVCQNTETVYVKADERDTALAHSLGQSIVITPLLVNDTARFVPEFMAGILTHEACHVCYGKVLQKEHNPRDEFIAYSHGTTALEMVDAPKWMVEESKSLRGVYGEE